jgi:Na+/H+-dicarboxylate symporter
MTSPLEERVPKRPIPLYMRVLIGVFVGAALGVAFGKKPYFLGLANKDLGDLGILVIDLLKALATPLILFAILDSFVRTRIMARDGGRLILICLVNVSVAMSIGLFIMNTLQPGRQWQGKFQQLEQAAHSSTTTEEMLAKSKQGTLNFVSNVKTYIPKSLLEPLVENKIIPLVLIGLLGGAALRRIRQKQEAEGEDSILVVERFVAATYQILLQMLDWVILTIPFAVCGVVAKVVGEHGLGVFSVLWLFLAVMLLGLAIHSLIYYPLVAWFVGRKPPRVYLGIGGEAIITGLSINSSLATVPITLKCLNKMGVSPASSRLAACVGTNLNNDGITLYEAMAALFLAQASGFHLGLGQQLVVVFSSIMAGAGVAGIPEAGLIVLPLVLSAANLPTEQVALWLPLIFTVDWIIARCRSGVNVMSDMLVAILLDRGRRPEESAEEGAVPEECMTV